MLRQMRKYVHNENEEKEYKTKAELRSDRPLWVKQDLFPIALPEERRSRRGALWGQLLGWRIIFNSGALTYFIRSQDCC